MLGAGQLLLPLSPWGRRPWTLPFFRQRTSGILFCSPSPPGGGDPGPYPSSARELQVPAFTPLLPLGEETLDLTLLLPENFRYPLLLPFSPCGRRPWTLPFFRRRTSGTRFYSPSSPGGRPWTLPFFRRRTSGIRFSSPSPPGRRPWTLPFFRWRTSGIRFSSPSPPGGGDPGLYPSSTRELQVSTFDPLLP
jgi:hypothetical protein